MTALTFGRGLPGKFFLAAFLLLSLTITVPSFADVVVANNAGDLPGTAQDLTGLNSFTEITGALDPTAGIYVNMFEFHIQDYMNFSALTVLPGTHGITDTELFLFDSSGNAVYMNDDISGSNTLSFLPNPSGGLGPLANGTYFLAIAYATDLPFDAGLNYLFNAGATTDVLGSAGAGPIAGWDNGILTNPNTDQVNYDIVFTGTVPEPGTFILAANGLGVILLGRKRFSLGERIARVREAVKL